MDDTLSLREETKQSVLQARDFFRVSSPLFAALLAESAADAQILDLCTAARRGQLPGILLMCVVHYLVLREPRSGLAAWFPSVTDTPKPAGTAFPVFREFCLEHRERIAELLSWRTVNTNLAEKAASLLPAMAYVARRAGEPLTLIEICCSSGLNMLFDEYHYDYGPFGRVGPESSPVQLKCKVVGNGRPPVDAIPIIGTRVGVDLVTIDVSDADERLWMEAVLAPEWRAERDTLRSALELRQRKDLNIIEGDALQVLPRLLESLAGPVCILQSYCIGHWSMEARAALEDLLCKSSRDRVIHRLAVESPDIDPPSAIRTRLIRLGEAGIPLLQKSSPSTIELLVYENSRMSTQLLGEGSIFGTWLDWRV